MLPTKTLCLSLCLSAAIHIREWACGHLEPFVFFGLSLYMAFKNIC